MGKNLLHLIILVPCLYLRLGLGELPNSSVLQGGILELGERYPLLDQDEQRVLESKLPAILAFSAVCHWEEGNLMVSKMPAVTELSRIRSGPFSCTVSDLCTMSPWQNVLPSSYR